MGNCGVEPGPPALGVPSDPGVRHTTPVSQNTLRAPGERARALFAGAWLRLLGDPASQPRDLTGFLGLLIKDLGARGILWLPDVGPAVWSGRYQPRDVDWATFGSLVAGECRGIHLAPGSRRPWGATGQGEDWYVRIRADNGPGGRLRVWFAGTGFEEGVQALALGDLVAGAGVLIAERLQAKQDQGALQLGSKAAGFVHDLRNRLTLVLLQQERFVMENEAGASNAEGLELLEQARALCASFVPTGDLGLVPQTTLLRPLLIQEARSAATMARRGAGVAVKVRCPAGLQAWVDPVGLIRVLDNLLLNAIEASQSGGEVRIQAQRVPAGVQISVEDFGAGMSEQGLQRAFAAGKSAGSSSGGTGYGSVSLLSTLADMGGDLRVDSALGSGTRVQVTLPNPFESNHARVIIIEPDARKSQGLMRQARRESILAMELSDCTAAIRLVGEMNIAQVWVPRGLRDPALANLKHLLESQDIPLYLTSARGLLQVEWSLNS